MNRERLAKLYKDNNLDKSDIFMLKMGGKEIPIIKREGIEKIQARRNILVTYEVISSDLSNIILKVTGSIDGGIPIQTFGEASPKNTQQAYPVAMAEKRGLSRVVLKLIGLYSEGFKGEDETIIKDKKEYSVMQLKASQLLEDSTLIDHNRAYAETQIEAGGDMSDLIEYLKEHQREGQTEQRENRLKQLQSR